MSMNPSNRAIRFGLRLLLIAPFLGVNVVQADPGAQADPVIARGDHHRVTPLDLDARMFNAPRSAVIGAINNPLMLKKMTDSLFAQRVIADQARTMGLDKDPVIQAKIREMTDGLLFSERMRLLDKESVPDMTAAAKERYDADPQAWSEPEKVAVAHILIREKTRYKDVRGDEEARKLANDLYRRLKNGESFAELAQRYSEDPTTAPRGGVLGVYTRGQLTKPFEDAAFKLTEENDISKPVKSEFGYHIIKLYRHIPQKPHTFAEVKDKLVEQLAARFRAQRRDEFLIKAREGEHYRLDEAALKGFADRKRAELKAARIPEHTESGRKPVDEKGVFARSRGNPEG